MKLNPDEWYIGPADGGFDYYKALTHAIYLAKSFGHSEIDIEVKLLESLRKRHQEWTIRFLYDVELQTMYDPKAFGLPSFEELKEHFPSGTAPWREVITWALENWREEKAVEGCKFKDYGL